MEHASTKNAQTRVCVCWCSTVCYRAKKDALPGSGAAPKGRESLKTDCLNYFENAGKYLVVGIYTTHIQRGI